MKRSALELLIDAQIEQAGLPKPEREHRFDPVRRWRLDWAWPAHNTALEAEGGIYSRGRHTRGAGFEGDCYKYNAATLAGWRVYRVTSGMARRNEVVPLLRKALKQRRERQP